MDVSMESKSEFKLSATLGCKESGIRDIAAASDDLICTCEERGAINVWERRVGSVQGDEKEFQIKPVALLPYPHEKGFTFCVEAAKKSFPLGTFISGGADKTARPIHVSGEQLFPPLIGHTNCVNSISETSEGMLLTGSWDGTARMWGIDNQTTIKVLQGHEHAVEVLGLSNGSIVTGSANKSIIIFDKDGNVIKRIPNAHTHAVRKLIEHPFGFASSGNDGFVRVWSLQGENLLSIDTHSQAEHPFVYGLTLLPNGDLAASGEDGNVRIWSADGTRLVQTLKHPGPVRALKTLPNGDLLTACADKCARIFTRSSARVASDADLAEYESYVNLVTSSGNMKLDTDNLPDESALLVAGRKEGDIKVVKIQGKGMVFQWNSRKLEWEMFGEAVGRKDNKEKKVMLNGIEYDYVTDVFVDESNRSIRLGINRDDDPDDLAHHFCTIHGVPFTVKQQIVDHIRPMTDPNLAAIRKMNEKALHDATTLIHVPAWASSGFQLHSEFKSAAFKTKMLQLSGEQGDNALNDKEQATLSNLVRKLEDKPNYHSAPISKEEEALLQKLLTWPTAALPPVLDGVRILMCLTSGCRLMNDVNFSYLLLKLAQEGTHVHQSLVLKAFTNWLAKREKNSSERQSVSSDLLSVVRRVVTQFGTISAGEAASSTLTASYVFFVYNVVVWLGRVNPKQGAELFPIMAQSLLLGLNKSDLSDKTAFFGLVALGTMGHCQRDVLSDQNAAQLRTILKHLREKFGGTVDQAVQDCSRVFAI